MITKYIVSTVFTQTIYYSIFHSAAVLLYRYIQMYKQRCYVEMHKLIYWKVVTCLHMILEGIGYDYCIICLYIFKMFIIILCSESSLDFRRILQHNHNTFDMKNSPLHQHSESNKYKDNCSIVICELDCVWKRIQ